MKRVDETAMVQAGMELLRWHYDTTEVAQLRKSGRFGCYFQTIGLHVQTLLGSCLGLVFVPIGFIAGGPVVGLVTSGVAALLTWVVGKNLTPVGLPSTLQVIFTSTGVIFGELGYLWRGSRVGELREVWIEGQSPARLILRFRGGGRNTELVLPCPAGLEDDVGELAELLTAKTSRLSAASQPPHSTPER